MFNRVELSRDICSQSRTRSSHNSAVWRYVRDTTAANTLVLEKVAMGLELALKQRDSDSSDNQSAGGNRFHVRKPYKSANNAKIIQSSVQY